MERISFYRNVTTEEARIRVLFVVEVHGRPRTRIEGSKQASKQGKGREKERKEEKKKDEKRASVSHLKVLIAHGLDFMLLIFHLGAGSY